VINEVLSEINGSFPVQQLETTGNGTTIGSRERGALRYSGGVQTRIATIIVIGSRSMIVSTLT
jgi:hypothetical protein